jgi:hypothetical protein
MLSNDQQIRPSRRLRNLACAAALLLSAAPAAANDAACGRVLGAGAIFDAGRGNCVAPNTIEQLCMQLPGYIRWQRTGRLGTCEFAAPGTGASRLPPQPPPGDAELRVPAGCAEAKQNIDWVMLRDAGAWRSYSSARRRSGPYDSLLFAQRHNPHAQLTIQRCAGWADAYARLLERNGRTPDPSAGGDQDQQKPTRWGALAAGIEEGRPDRVGIGAAVKYAMLQDAERDALRACRQRASACQIVSRFSRGCGYITWGRNSQGQVGWGSGATSDAARASCALRGLTCYTPIGGCVD